MKIKITKLEVGLINDNDAEITASYTILFPGNNFASGHRKYSKKLSVESIRNEISENIVKEVNATE